MERYLPLFENAVVVCREVSGGIVPMDGEERGVAGAPRYVYAGAGPQG